MPRLCINEVLHGKASRAPRTQFQIKTPIAYENPYFLELFLFNQVLMVYNRK